MNAFKVKLITILIAFGFIITALAGLTQYYVKPLCDWNWFLGIAIFFLIIESTIVSYVEGVSRNKEKKKMVNAYMLTKVVKLILSLFFVTVYALVVKENIKGFVIIFILFYFLYLMVEVFLFSRIEKHIKESENNE